MERTQERTEHQRPAFRLPWWVLFILAATAGLIGALLLVAVLGDTPAWDHPSSKAKALHRSGEQLTVIRGKGAGDGRSLRLTTDPQGQAAVALDDLGFRAADYSYFVLRGRHLGRATSAVLLWTATPQDTPLRLDRPRAAGTQGLSEIPLRGWAPIWVALDDRTGDPGAAVWSADNARSVTAAELHFQAPPDTSLRIDAVEFRPTSMANWVRHLISGWAWYEPWEQWSINRYPGSTSGLAIQYRLPVALTFLACGLLSYVGIALVLRLRPWRRFDWRVAAGLLVVAWLMLDMPWQWSLLRQLDDTRRNFAGKTAAEKTLNNYDARLAALLEHWRPLIDHQDARVFIATAAPSEFVAIRAAYRLYPLNVFWQRGGPELPSAQALRAGDFVLAIDARDLRYNAQSRLLTWSLGQARAQRLSESKHGALYKILEPSRVGAL